jgi:glycosyltransferase involved in cell wall biosynthesis
MPSRTAVSRVDVQAESPLDQLLAIPVRRRLAEIGSVGRPHLVHSHGLWQPANHWAARSAQQWQVPLVIQPRGMLEPWALAQKKVKKRVALALFQGRDLQRATALVASSDMECESVRRFGLSQPVAVIANGTQLPSKAALEPGRRARNRTRVALFLSRIHPQKGTRELIRAWAHAAPAGWRLAIAGPDDHGHWAEIEHLVRQLNLREVVDYVGPVADVQKTAAFQQADLFVLPTFSESFGMAVAEALAHGLPVITTRGAPWSDLVAHRCGWWIDIGVEPLAEAIRQATSLSDDERWRMGERGRNYVRRFDWDAISSQMLALYYWLLRLGDCPDCVRRD